MEVHYRDQGAERAPCILMLHDIGSSLHAFEHWADTMQLEYRVLRLDLPGFGLTGPHPKGDYSMKMYRDFLDEFLADMGVKRCYVVGNGLGGRLAWELALAYPKRVRKLVMISPSGFPNDKANKTAMEKMAGGNAAQKRQFRYFTSKKLVRKTLKQNYYDEEKVKIETVKRHYELLRRKGNRKAYIDRVNHEDYNRTRRIKDIEAPTLIMWGTENQVIPIEHASYFHKALPNSKLKMYPETGHYLMEEIASVAAPDVMSFLNYRQ
jgi:pimeloyl-ACP methyl ester carboxylesterase